MQSGSIFIDKTKSQRFNAARRQFTFAIKTRTAVDREWRNNSVTGFEFGDSFTAFFNNSNKLMAHDGAHPNSRITAMNNVQIRTADAGRCHPQNYVGWILDSGRISLL